MLPSSYRLRRPASPVLGGRRTGTPPEDRDGSLWAEVIGGGGGDDMAGPVGPVPGVDDVLAVDDVAGTPPAQVMVRSLEPALPATEAMIVAVPALAGALKVVEKVPPLVAPTFGSSDPVDE